MFVRHDTEDSKQAVDKGRFFPIYFYPFLGGVLSSEQGRVKIGAVQEPYFNKNTTVRVATIPAITAFLTHSIYEQPGIHEPIGINLGLYSFSPYVTMITADAVKVFHLKSNSEWRLETEGSQRLLAYTIWGDGEIVSLYARQTNGVARPEFDNQGLVRPRTPEALAVVNKRLAELKSGSGVIIDSTNYTKVGAVKDSAGAETAGIRPSVICGCTQFKTGRAKGVAGS